MTTIFTPAQFEEGIKYAEDNFQNEAANHLRVDKQLIRRKFDLTGMQVLDFGCGMGGMSLWYAHNWDCKVHAVDIDGQHIQVAKLVQEKHGVTNVLFEKRDILAKPLEGSYDFIFMNDVAEHIDYPILERILRQLAKVVSAKGRLFISYPPWRSPYASHVTHIVGLPWCQFLPKRMLLNLIEKNNQPLVGEHESDLLQAYHGLNHLTHRKLMEVASNAGWKTVTRKSHSILNKLPGLRDINFNVFPFDFIVTKEFLLLEKA